MGRRERSWVAYHEAGHAVAAVVLRRAALHVTIVEGDHFNGRLLPRSGTRDPQEVLDPAAAWRCRRDAVIAAAGPAAQARYTHRSLCAVWQSYAASSDRPVALELLHAVGDYTVSREYDSRFGREVTVEDLSEGERRTLAEASELIRLRWPAGESLARELLRAGTVSGKRLRELVKAAPQRTIASRQGFMAGPQRRAATAGAPFYWRDHEELRGGSAST